MELEPIDGSSYNIKKAYIYANSQILAQYDGTDKYYYLHDRLGSVRQVLNSSGAVVKMLTYNPFGETIEEQGTFYTPWQFTGQFLDDETGQYYLRARQYSPYLSRFTGRDLIMGNFDEPMTLHKYLYCTNDPIDWIDPSGLDKYWGFEKNGHMYVGVDIWKDGKKTGQRRYDFTPGGYEWEGNWAYLGALINVFIAGPGEVRSSDFEYDKTKGVLKLKQSQEADEQMEKTLNELMKNPPPYSFPFLNCWDFSLISLGINYNVDFGSSYNDPAGRNSPDIYL